MRMLRRHRTGRVGAVAVTGALAVVLAACGGGSGGGSDGGGGGGEESNLIVGTTDSVDTVDPAKCYSYYCSTILDNVGETLVSYQSGSTELAPQLARKLPETSDDGKTYTIPLRKGVTFHDGSKMTAKDVKHSLLRAVRMHHPEGAGFLLSGIKKIDTPDKYTVAIHLKSPDVTFGSKLAYDVATIVPSSYPAPKKPLPEDVSRKKSEKYVKEDFVGTGPYKLADFREGESITLNAFDDYWGDAPKSDNVLVKFYKKSAQMLAAFKSGEIDVAFRYFTPEQRQSLKDSGDVKLVEGEGAEIRYLVMNPRLSPVDSAKVRKAIAAGVERKRIIKNVLAGAGEPLYSMIPPSFDANKPVFKQKYGDKKATDFVNGKVKLTLWYSTNHYGPTEPDLAQSVARSLEETGAFDVTLKSSEWAQFTEDAYPGETGQYPIFLLGWYPDYLDPDDYIAPFYGCKDSFLVMYCNDTMNKRIEQESTADAPDSKQRMQTFAKIQQQSAEDVPLIPLYVNTPFAFAHKDVKGVKDTMGPEQIFRYYLIHKSG